MPAPLSLNSRIISRISDERTWHFLQENKVMFSKKKIYIYTYFEIFDGIFGKLRIDIKMPASLSLLTVE